MILFDYFRIWNSLKKNSRRTYSELKRIQEKKLREIISYSYNNVPYYKNLFDKKGIKPGDIKTVKDLQKIPITTRDDFIKFNKKILSKNIKKKDCRQKRTGGSIGKPLVFYHTRLDNLYSSLSYDRARYENGFNASKNRLLIAGDFSHGALNATIKDKIKAYARFRKCFIGLNIFASMNDQIEILQKGNFDAIYCYPSYVKFLIEKLDEYKLKPKKIKYFFTASEMLSPDIRHLIYKKFGVKVTDIYGAFEAGCIAWECEMHKGYHINIDLLVLEVITNNNQIKEFGRGRLIITNLHSRAMPFIRYELSDVVEITKKPCPCGRPFPLIKRIIGRNNDFICLPNNKKLPPGKFLIVLNKRVKHITQSQIVQTTKNGIDVKVVSENRRFERHIKKELIAEFRRLLPSDMKINIKFVDKIPKTRSGKFTSIISKVL
ncbi:MAG: hypothetical protein QXG00_03650 [Candidatus Woesearchaeota archaeon]